jgi:uncharacterized membrane protein
LSADLLPGFEASRMTSLGWIIFLITSTVIPTALDAVGRPRLSLAAALFIGVIGAFCWWFGVGIDVPRRTGEPLLALLSVCYLGALVWQMWWIARQHRASSKSGS